jgi:hypothetical protein
MTTPDTTEDFTAASPEADDGSARWARRLAVRLPVRLPLRIPARLPLRRGRTLETAPFDPNATHTGDAPAPQSGWRLEPTHRLAGFELRSVASTALLYYACAFAVLALGVVLVWFGASMFGIVGRVEEFMRSIGFRGFHFAGFEVIAGGILLCVAAVAFLTVMTVLAAAFYNLLGRPERGVKLCLAPIPSTVAVEAPSLRDGNGNGDATSNGDAKGDGNGDGSGQAAGDGSGNANGNGNGHHR